MPLAILLMVFFVALMVVAWRAGATEECGCFGALYQRSPQQAAVEDMVMLVLLIFAAWGMWRQPAWPGASWLVAGGTVLALVVGALRFVPDMERLERSDLLPGVRLTGLEVKGLEQDLHEGELLIELFSPYCGRCLQSVPKLNAVDAAEDLPPVFGLSSFPHDGEAMREFMRRSGLAYPVGTITKTDYFRLTWGHGYPRLALLRDGVVVRVWEYNELPTAAELRATLGARQDSAAAD
jgi:hypothetical protein